MIPNRGVPLVPNVGVIGGAHSVLVVETGMGPRNAEAVLGFAGEATYLVNAAQAEDLAAKGDGYLHMFRGLGAPVARQLEGVGLRAPDVVYGEAHDLDLGGRVVRLRATGRAHSRGDQVVTVPDAGVMFTGDLAEAGQFAIFPWFPPHDTDVSGTRWIAVMRRLAERAPRVVVPGHGDVGGPGLLADVRDYLELLRDETWARRDSAAGEEAIAGEIRALMIERHPEWAGREWIERGVGCLCAEHPDASAEE
ncbi:MBL fold metallo-hydrolase [Actinomadura nitritigenes]|uniref:MBL fold metallo-hydrolase n=1 Tax=Actinomadura nitritigenes TaxID=134602 RepID=UPI003D8A5206